MLAQEISKILSTSSMALDVVCIVKKVAVGTGLLLSKGEVVVGIVVRRWPSRHWEVGVSMCLANALPKQ